MKEDSKVPLILGRLFLHTADVVIRIKQKQLNLGVGTERMTFHMDYETKHSYSNDDTRFSIDVIDEIIEEDFDALIDEEPPTDLQLKPLPDNLEYAFLEEPSFLLVIISSQLLEQDKIKLISVLKRHKQAFAWKTTDILGISDSPWVSPIHCVPKKGGITIVTNEINELVLTRTVTESVEVFMDDFFVFGNSFDHCLNNLDKILQRCKDANIVLNLEKCQFMVKEGIMLGYKVSSTGLEVDKAKIDVISKLLPPTNVKSIRSFLGHVGFYRRFIKDFSKIARPLTKLLEKDTSFEFNDECHKAFNSLKEKLTCTPVIVSPNWNLLFELMCDASDFAVGAVLEFDIEIKDKKGTENFAADHLSQIENDETSDDSDVNDNFLEKLLWK
ncbi:reverse transcriptase domain-containing protein [Tanacetum coccineum]